MKFIKIIFIISILGFILLGGCKKELVVDKEEPQDLGYDFAKDEQYVYFRGEKIEGADPETFEIINKDVSKDNSGVYFKEYRKVGSMSSTRIVNLSESIGVDKDSVEDIQYPFFKDKNNIYYVAQNPSGNNFVKKLEGAEINTFEVLNKNIVKFNNSIYHVALANPSTITDLRGREYSTDEKGKIFSSGGIDNFNSDIPSFEILNDHYAKDNNQAYCYDDYGFRKIDSADIVTFEIINETYAKDKNYVYTCKKGWVEKLEG